MSLKNPILRNGTLREETRVGCVATEGAAGATDSRSSAPRPRSLWWRPKEMAARVSRQAFRARACGSLWSRERSPISVTSAILLRDRRPELQLGTDGFHKKKIPPAAGRFAMPVDQATFPTRAFSCGRPPRGFLGGVASHRAARAMEASGFMRVARALDAASAGALRREVLSELSKQPWWWSTPLRAMFATEKNIDARASAASGTRASSASSSLFQEANIRSSFRRRLLVLPVDDPAHPERSTPLGALCRQAILAVVRAHAERCRSPDGKPLLSPDARLVELTAVVALPGAFAQDPHADITDEDEEEEEDEDLSRAPVAPPEKRRLPALLTSWVSLQPVTLAGGPTVIFPGTHARGAGLARMAPKAVRAYRGSDLSEEDELFIQLMHGDAVDAANEGYAVAALDLTQAEREDAEKTNRERKRRERWWRRLHADAAGAARGADVARVAENTRQVSLRAQRREGTVGDDDAGCDDRDEEEGDREPSASASATPSFDAERDEPPVPMTNAHAGDLVVMDTKVWHFGSANTSFVPRVLLNVTFQEPSARRPADAAAADGAGDAARDAKPCRKKKKRDDVLRRGGWVEDVGEETDERTARLNLPPSLPLMEVRRIDGFTYHVHESVLGKYAVRDFMPGGAMRSL